MMERYWSKEALFDLVNLIVAAFLFVTPWIFGFASVGWASLVLGLGLIVSPWILGFHDTVMLAMRVDVVVGMVVVVLAAGELWFTRQASQSVMA